MFLQGALDQHSQHHSRALRASAVGFVQRSAGGGVALVRVLNVPLGIPAARSRDPRMLVIVAVPSPVYAPAGRGVGAPRTKIKDPTGQVPR